MSNTYDDDRYEEEILDNDYPMLKGRWYIVRGEPYRATANETVGDFKKREFVDEVSSCDFVGRELLPSRFEGLSTSITLAELMATPPELRR